MLAIATAVALFSSLAAQAADDLSHSPGWVVIPIEEYRTLHTKAFPIEPEPEQPPVEATLTRADYDLEVAGELATGRVSLTVDVLKEGWVRVPVPNGLLVREAHLDGKLLSLVTSGNKGGQVQAVLSHPGRAVLLLNIALPVTSTAGEESISLPATTSGVTRASVELPHQGLDLKLRGGLLSEKAGPSGDAAENKWIAYGRGNEPLTFTWKRKTEDHRLNQPLRLRGAITQLVGLGEDSASVNAEVNLEVVQGAARQVTIQLPQAITVNQVSGAMVADWEMKPGELAVTFLEPLEERARFVITGEGRLPRDGEIQIPVLRLLEAERESGGLAVEVLGAGEIKAAKPQGLESADATDLGEMVSSRQSPSLAAFRFRPGDAKTPRSLSVNVARYVQQAVLMANIEEARYHVLMSSEGKTLILARYAVRNNQRNFLKITLPPDASIWSAALAGRPVRPGESPDGGLLLPLEKGRGGEEAPAFAVEVLYLVRGSLWTDKGKLKIALPALDLPISRTGLLLHYPPLFRVSAERGAFRTETYEAPTSTAFSPASSSGLGAGRAGGMLGALIDEKQQLSVNSPAPGAPQGQSADQALVDQFLNEGHHGKRSGILPLRVPFPAFGPSLFLVSELTAEAQAGNIELDYQRDKKAGAR